MEIKPFNIGDKKCMTKVIIGIDPGSSGCIAWSENGETNQTKMPETYQDIYDKLKEISMGNDCVCYLEDVGKGMPGQSSKATATFARHNGHIEMALYALGIKVEKVLPNKWQKTLGIGKGSDCSDKREWKNKLKQKAQELYPQVKITLWNADGLLILDYATKQERR